MKHLVLALGAASLVTFAAGAADAGKSKLNYVCWTATGGYTDCDWLPHRYYVPGVKKPTCHKVGKTDKVDFTLTWPRIHAFQSQGVRTDTMRPPHWAQLTRICSGC